MLGLSEVLQEIGKHKGGLPTSYSRMHTLLGCPLSFILRYQKKIQLPKLPANDDMVVGKQAHWIMEQSMRTAYSCQDFSLSGAEFDFFFDYVYQRSTVEQASLFSDIQKPMMAVLDRLLQLMSTAGTEISTEKKITLSPGGLPVKPTRAYYPKGKYPPLGFLGYIDLEMRRGGWMNLVDYKTEHPTRERREEVICQTGIYSYVEFLSDPTLNNVNTYCIYLKDATIDKVAHYNRERDFASLEHNVLTLMNDYLVALENLEPEPRENRYCEYCDFRVAGMCPLHKEMTNGETAQERREKVGNLGAVA